MQHAMHEIGRRGQAPVPPVLPFVLRPGDWASSMKLIDYKVLIAEALNATVDEDGDYRDTLVGYFITDKSLYLVWRVAEKKVERLFHFFYDRVRDNIRRHFAETKHTALKNLLHEEQMSREELFDGLFRRSVLHDEHLVRLITGRKVELPYSDPYLDRLRAEIHNHPFCSALDYEGAIGPVHVRLMNAKDWKELEHQRKMNLE